jgi:hypothetical protein
LYHGEKNYGNYCLTFGAPQDQSNPNPNFGETVPLSTVLITEVGDLDEGGAGVDIIVCSLLVCTHNFSCTQFGKY